MANLPPIVDPTIAIAKCSVFLQVHEDEVSVVHQSAKEFLRNKMESPLKVHAEIIGFCLKHLSKEFTTTASTKRTSSEQPAHYATLYWLQHLSVVLDDGLEGKTKTIDAVAWFLDKHFLQWIETLPPFSGIPQVLIQMSILEDKLRVCSNHLMPLWKCLVQLTLSGLGQLRMVMQIFAVHQMQTKGEVCLLYPTSYATGFYQRICTILIKFLDLITHKRWSSPTAIAVVTPASDNNPLPNCPSFDSTQPFGKEWAKGPRDARMRAAGNAKST